MAIRIENHCCGCDTPSYPCLGARCPRRNTEVYYCDVCGEEIIGDIYEVDDEDLCEFCLTKKFKKEV